MWVRALAVAVVAVLIVLVAIALPRIRACEHFLAGFWVGDPTFLRKAGLSEVYLYIAPSEKDSPRGRQGYLVMLDAAGSLVSNQGVELSWSGLPGRAASALKGLFSPDRVYEVAAARIAYDDEAVMPEALSLGLNVAQGTIALFTDEKLYAFLVKDNETSMAANAAWAGSGEP